MNQDQNPVSICPGGRSPMEQGSKGAVAAVDGPPGPQTVTEAGATQNPGAAEDDSSVRRGSNR